MEWGFGTVFVTHRISAISTQVTKQIFLFENPLQSYVHCTSALYYSKSREKSNEHCLTYANLLVHAVCLFYVMLLDMYTKIIPTEQNSRFPFDEQRNNSFGRLKPPA